MECKSTMSSTEQNLTKNDLNLLMESYKNMFLMHQTILDQQTQMAETLQKIVDKQSKSCNEMEKISYTLKDCVDVLKENQKDFRENITNVNDKIANHNATSIDGHGKIKNSVYIAMVGSATIILTLLGMGWKLYADHQAITEILHTVQHIATNMGI